MLDLGQFYNPTSSNLCGKMTRSRLLWTIIVLATITTAIQPQRRFIHIVADRIVRAVWTHDGEVRHLNIIAHLQSPRQHPTTIFL